MTGNGVETEQAPPPGQMLSAESDQSPCARSNQVKGAGAEYVPHGFRRSKVGSMVGAGVVGVIVGKDCARQRMSTGWVCTRHAAGKSPIPQGMTQPQRK